MVAGKNKFEIFHMNHPNEIDVEDAAKTITENRFNEIQTVIQLSTIHGVIFLHCWTISSFFFVCSSYAVLVLDFKINIY